jgi:hypothetical protein
MHPRRGYERLRQTAAAESLPAIASVRRGERDAISGTALARPFPGASELLTAGYACVEDLPDPATDDVDDARDELERVVDLDPDLIDTILTTRGYDLSES